MTTAEEFAALMPDTPAGRRAIWLMGHTLSRGQDVTKEEVFEEHPPRETSTFDLENYRGDFKWANDNLGADFIVESVDGEDPLSVRLLILAKSGRRWEWTVIVAAEPPHPIVRWILTRALPPGVEIRVARPEDAHALSEVARRAPIRLTDVTVTIDPGDDYFAPLRLMGDTAVTFVATHDNRPVGIHCAVAYPGRVNGEEKTLCLIAHSRLLPEFTGGGIWGRLNDTVFDHFGDFGRDNQGVAYVRPENAAAQRLGGAESRWGTRPFRAVLDCATTAGPEQGRPATPADAHRVIELINACHRDEEFFFPYTEPRLVDRLNRAPDLYSWHSILLGERAVVGVWASGQTHTKVPDGGEPIVSRRAIVLDYGFEPGAEDELEALLRAWCGRLVPTEITHLGIFSSPASLGSERLRALASSIEEYDVMPPGVEEPPTAKVQGIYIDAVYF